MRAVVYDKYGTPDVLRLQEVKTPTPKDNEILIRVHAAVVTNADCAARKGKPLAARLAFGLFKPKNTILGTEFSGEIITVGKQVKLFKKGDLVYAATGTDFGAHAEYICMPEDGALSPKPANVTHEEAAAICEGALTALPFLRDEGHIQKGQKVLINGASGSVGTAAVQLAHYFGTEVTGVCSSKNVALVKSLGADNVIDYTKEDFTKTGQNYDIIFDTVGKSSFSRCKNSLSPKGIYLSTVLKFGTMLQMLRTSKFSSKKAIITFTGLRSAEEKTKDLVFIRELIEAEKIRPVIDRRYSLEKIPNAHRYVEKGHKIGNVVVVINENSDDFEAS